MKKNKLKNYLQLGILLFGISFLLWNCKDEENFEVKLTELHGLNLENSNLVKILSIENIPKLETVVKNILKVETIPLEEISRDFNFLNDIENLNTDEIAVYTDETGYSTYTFKFNNSQESINFENLYLLETENGGYIAYILSYEPNQEWYYNNLNEQGILNFDVNMYKGIITKYSLEREIIWSSDVIDGNSNTQSRGSSVAQVCVYSMVSACTYEGAENCGGATCGYTVSESCTSVWVSGGGGSGNDNSNNDSNGGEGSDTDPCNNAIGTPVVNDQPLSGVGGDCAPNGTGGAINTPPTCPNGQVDSNTGNCIPCPKNPLPNIELAHQLGASGWKGGMFGCTRFGANHCTTPRNKKHKGLDLANPYGAPIYAMYDGVVTKFTQKKNGIVIGAGHYVSITSTVNGELIKILYFHMQENGRQSGTVQAGDIIGFQGDSGNLKGAIADDYAISHLHIKIKDSNNNAIDPRAYLGTEMDINGNVTQNQGCN